MGFVVTQFALAMSRISRSIALFSPRTLVSGPSLALLAMCFAAFLFRVWRAVAVAVRNAETASACDMQTFTQIAIVAACLGLTTTHGLSNTLQQLERTRSNVGSWKILVRILSVSACVRFRVAHACVWRLTRASRSVEA